MSATHCGQTQECVHGRWRLLWTILRFSLLFFSFFPDPHRWAVFLLLQLGEQIQDTEMVLVDRTLTDISFQNNVLL